MQERSVSEKIEDNHKESELNELDQKILPLDNPNAEKLDYKIVISNFSQENALTPPRREALHPRSHSSALT